MTSRPRVSVVIPSYCADRTLPRVLAALRHQIDDHTEVLIVDSSGPQRTALLQREHPWLRVIELAERTLPGRARNLGVAASRSDRVAFLDADTVPTSEWLHGLEATMTSGNALAVAGAVRNGTPHSPIGTTSYLLEFSEVMPGRAGELSHGVSCNLLVDRAAFEAVGGFQEDAWPGEDTILTVPWALQNRLMFAPEAAVWHLNRIGTWELIRHQYRLGQSFAKVCDTVPVPYDRFSHWPLLGLAPPLRLLALWNRLRHHPRPLFLGILLSPLLSVGLLAWGSGVAAARLGSGAPEPPLVE